MRLQKNSACLVSRTSSVMCSPLWDVTVCWSEVARYMEDFLFLILERIEFKSFLSFLLSFASHRKG